MPVLPSTVPHAANVYQAKVAQRLGSVDLSHFSMPRPAVAYMFSPNEESGPSPPSPPPFWNCRYCFSAFRFSLTPSAPFLHRMNSPSDFGITQLLLFSRSFSLLILVLSAIPSEDSSESSTYYQTEALDSSTSLSNSSGSNPAEPAPVVPLSLPLPAVQIKKSRRRGAFAFPDPSQLTSSPLTASAPIPNSIYESDESPYGSGALPHDLIPTRLSETVAIVNRHPAPDAQRETGSRSAYSPLLS